MARQAKQDEVEENPIAQPLPMLFGADGDDEEDVEMEEIPTEPDEEDIFEYWGAKFAASGDRVTYTIYKDGDFIAGSVKHPYSWDQIKRTYGSGTFKVIARSKLKGRYVKSQSKNIVELESDREDRVSEPKGNSTTELLALIQAQKREEREEQERIQERRDRERREQDERRETERREREAQMKAAGDNTMLMMMKMMEASSAQTTALLTAMISNKKEPELNVEKIMQLMDSRMEKMIAMVTGKDKTKDIDALKLIELQALAEDRGYKRAMDVHEQAEKKAEELAEMRESASATPEKPAEPSTTKMLLEAVIPAVQAVMAARGGFPSVATAPAAPAILPAGVNPNKPATPYKPNIAMKPPTVVQAKPVTKPVETKPVSLRERIEQTVISEIAKDLTPGNIMTQKFNPEKVADKCLEILKPFNVTPFSLSKDFTLQDIYAVAKKAGSPDAIRPYLDRFHARIIALIPKAAPEAVEKPEIITPEKV